MGTCSQLKTTYSVKYYLEEPLQLLLSPPGAGYIKTPVTATLRLSQDQEPRTGHHETWTPAPPTGLPLTSLLPTTAALSHQRIVLLTVTVLSRTIRHHRSRATHPILDCPSALSPGTAAPLLLEGPPSPDSATPHKSCPLPPFWRSVDTSHEHASNLRPSRTVYRPAT